MSSKKVQVIHILSFLSELFTWMTKNMLKEFETKLLMILSSQSSRDWVDRLLILFFIHSDAIQNKKWSIIHRNILNPLR